MHRSASLRAVAAAGLASLVACGPDPLAREGWPDPRPLGQDTKAYRPPRFEPPSLAPLGERSSHSKRAPDRGSEGSAHRRAEKAKGGKKPPTSDQGGEPGKPAPPPDTSTTPPRRSKNPKGKLSLRQALSLALKQNPELAAFGWEVRAAEARALQKSLPPNPSVELETEEFAKSDAGSVVDPAEAVVRLAQPVLTAGKLEKRTRVAELNRDLAGWDYEAKRLDVLTTTVQRFVDVLAAQERVAVAQETFNLAQQVHKTVSAQVKEGAVSPVERTRAKVELSTSRVELDRAERSLRAARQALVATWGATKARFEKAKGKLAEVEPIPPKKAVLREIEQNPAIARWATEIAKREADIRLAKARAWPNIKPTAGFQFFNGTDDTAAILSVELPVPLFDRNQGRILETRYALAKAKAQRRAARVRVRSTVGQAYERLRAAHEEVTTLRETTLPNARSAYEAIRQSYEAGQTDILDVLDTQRTLFRVERRYVRATADYHQAAAEVERLIAEPFEKLGGQNNEAKTQGEAGAKPKGDPSAGDADTNHDEKEGGSVGEATLDPPVGPMPEKLMGFPAKTAGLNKKEKQDEPK